MDHLKVMSVEQLKTTIAAQMWAYVRAAESAVEAYKAAKELHDALPWWRWVAGYRTMRIMQRAEALANQYTHAAAQMDSLRVKLRGEVGMEADEEGSGHE